MPTIRKKGDKQYHVHIRKRSYPTQTNAFTSLVAAEEWATAIESEMVRGVFVSRNEAEATLIKDVLDRFETEVLPTKRSEQSDKSRIKNEPASLTWEENKRHSTTVCCVDAHCDKPIA